MAIIEQNQLHKDHTHTLLMSSMAMEQNHLHKDYTHAHTRY